MILFSVASTLQKLKAESTLGMRGHLHLLLLLAVQGQKLDGNDITTFLCNIHIMLLGISGFILQVLYGYQA